MIALGVPFEEINAAHLQALIDDAVSEQRTIEYKRDLPGLTDDEKRELLADVSSFANAGGGDLVFGVGAEAGIPLQLNALDFDPDKETLRWGEVIRTGIQPRIPSVRMRPIAVEGGQVLLIRIERSWVAPHAVTFKSSSFRFYSRTAAGKFHLDLDQVRHAFVEGSDLANRIRDFQAERLGRIAADTGPLPLDTHPKLVAHLIPIGALAGPSEHDLSVIADTGLLQPGFQTGADGERWNIDGLLSLNLSDKGPAWSYTQLFRNGIIECVDAYFLEPDLHHERFTPPWLPGTRVERLLIEGIGRQLKLLERLDVAFPLVVLVAIIGLRGVMLVGRDTNWPYREPPSGLRRVDRDVLILPDLLIEDQAEDIPGTLRPLLDSLWQASGLRQSPYFDAEGNWNPPQ